MAISQPEYSDEQHKVSAGIIGEYMHAIITHPVTEAVRIAGIEQHVGTERAFERWVTAMRLLNEPTIGRPDIGDIEPAEATAIELAAKPHPVAQLATEALKNHRKLRKVTRGLPGLRESTGRKIDELLINGVVDSRNWISILLHEGFGYEEILEHPVFPTATTLITPAHMLLLGSFAKPGRPAGHLTAVTDYRPDSAPKTRPAAIAIIESTSHLEQALAYRTSGDDPWLRPLDSRGYCPAPIGRDASRQTWLTGLLSKVIDIHKKTDAAG